MEIQIFKIHILPSAPTKKYATSIKTQFPLLQTLYTTVSKQLLLLLLLLLLLIIQSRTFRSLVCCLEI
jgi:hypothetical protein